VVAPLAPPEHYLPIPHGYESVIAERYAMRIASQIREDVLRRGKRRLGIDDPGLLPQRREETLEGPGVPQGRRGPGKLQVVLGLGALESGKVFAAKHLGERFDGQEEVAALGRNPAVPLWGQRPKPRQHILSTSAELTGS
jgi:hypothetical protein